MLEIQLICGSHETIVENFTLVIMFVQTRLFFYLWGPRTRRAYHYLIKYCIYFILGMSTLQLESNIAKFWISCRKKLLLISKPSDYQIEGILEMRRLSIIFLQRRWFVQMRSRILAQLENTKMIKFLPLCFQGVSIVKARIS